MIYRYKVRFHVLLLILNMKNISLSRSTNHLQQSSGFSLLSVAISNPPENHIIKAKLNEQCTSKYDTEPLVTSPVVHAIEHLASHPVARHHNALEFRGRRRGLRLLLTNYVRRANKRTTPTRRNECITARFRDGDPVISSYSMALVADTCRMKRRC